MCSSMGWIKPLLLKNSYQWDSLLANWTSSLHPTACIRSPLMPLSKGLRNQLTKCGTICSQASFHRGLFVLRELSSDMHHNSLQNGRHRVESSTTKTCPQWFCMSLKTPMSNFIMYGSHDRLPPFYPDMNRNHFAVHRYK